MEDINLRKIFLKIISSPGRIRTREVAVGDVPLGGGYPIRLQSMATSPTGDTEACVEESLRIIRAGADYVRFTAQSVAEAENLANIRDALRRRGLTTPLIADVHFNPAIAETAARIVEKIRINPGNFVRILFPGETLSPGEKAVIVREQIRARLVPLLALCRRHHTALRIGVNHGSLAQRIVEEYGDTPRGMVVSAMEYLRICREEGFHQVVLSMKSSNARVMVQAYRLLVATMAAEGDLYPMHLGITEAGEGSAGRIRSATGMGALLADGIGDTLRVSLTEPSENEIPVARHLAHHFRDIPPDPGIPASYDPFDYHPPTLTGIPGISREPVVVAPAGLSAAGEVQPDLYYHDDDPHHLYTPGGNKVPILVLSATTSPLPAAEEVAGRVLVAEVRAGESMQTLRAFFARLEDQGLHNAVILKKNYDTMEEEAFRIAAAADLGPLFLDGYGQGIWICAGQRAQGAGRRAQGAGQRAQGAGQKAQGRMVLNQHPAPGTRHPVTGQRAQGEERRAQGAERRAQGAGQDNIEKKEDLSLPVVDTAFAILQAARVRTTRTEYISCPSCGRTLFDIQEVTARIRQHTRHLKGVKIAIMGCIVNGPGEMADADYGYVGAGPGRITLYHHREVVKKNIPADKAVEELVRLIKEKGDWVEER